MIRFLHIHRPIIDYNFETSKAIQHGKELVGTLAMEKDEENDSYVFSVSWVHPKDRAVRKIGKEVAEKNLKKNKFTISIPRRNIRTVRLAKDILKPILTRRSKYLDYFGLCEDGIVFTNFINSSLIEDAGCVEQVFGRKK